jgi:hypothetical protein
VRQLYFERASGGSRILSDYFAARLNRLRKECFFVIPSEARDLLFFAKPKKKQIPRANPALRNDMLRVFPQPLKPYPTKIR